MKVQPLVLDSAAELRAAFFAGRCQAYSSDASQLASMRASAPGGAGGYVILDERISKEPLGPVVRAGDEDWVTLVRWVLFVLIAAEEHGVTRANVAARMREPALQAPARRGRRIQQGARRRTRLGACASCRASATTARCSSATWARGSPLKLERGLNRPVDPGRPHVRAAACAEANEGHAVSDLHFYVTLGVFAAVILVIAFDVVDMALAALLGRQLPGRRSGS